MTAVAGIPAREARLALRPLPPGQLQAAVGVAQMAKLDRFVAVRRRNFARLHEALAGLEAVYVLPEASWSAARHAGSLSAAAKNDW